MVCSNVNWLPLCNCTSASRPRLRICRYVHTRPSQFPFSGLTLAISHGGRSPHSSTSGRYPLILSSTCSSCECYHGSYALSRVYTSPLRSMRYSRMLEESSFANRKADYFWLLLLSAIMLLVSPASSTLSNRTEKTYPSQRPCHHW